MMWPLAKKVMAVMAVLSGKCVFQLSPKKISGPVSVIILFSFIHDEGPGWSLLFRLDGLEMFSGAVCEIGLKFSLMNFSDR